MSEAEPSCKIFSAVVRPQIFFYKLVLAKECAHCLSGGMGYMQITKSEYSYRKVKVMMIDGGSKEILKDFAERQFEI